MRTNCEQLYAVYCGAVPLMWESVYLRKNHNVLYWAHCVVLLEQIEVKEETTLYILINAWSSSWASVAVVI